jgi:hypothetical protein
MTPLLITRIAGQLEKRFSGLIDMSDWESRPPADRKTAFLSRALAALCIKSISGCDAAGAGKAVTDGFGDNGLDAIYYDQNSDALLIVQSKWSTEGNTPIDAKSTLTMAQGARDLLNLDFQSFNDRIKAKEAEIRAAVFADRLRIVLVTAHTANQVIAPYVQGNIDDLVTELNNPVAQAEAQHFNQEGVYRLITAESEPQKIKLQITMQDWGSIERPFLAYYGRVHVNEIAAWWKDHGNALFAHNLRLFNFSSEVNDALKNTITTTPENFWYFNNGITVIADSVSKSAVGSPGRLIGLFNCESTSIVNGAQTVGTIGESWRAEDAAGSPAREAWVQVRIISLERCPPDLRQRITRAANLQNAVTNREFAAMDHVQHRLATEFALDKRKYAYKHGEADPKGDEGCTIVEATQALACEKSIQLAVQAKRELGAMWADTTAAPYTDLFNQNTTSLRVWRAVQITRVVDQELQNLRKSEAPRAELIAVHLKFVILHLVFQDPALKALRHSDGKDAECLVRAKQVTTSVFGEVTSFMQKHHADEYPAAFSKSYSRCEQLVGNLRRAPDKGQIDLQLSD